MKNILQGAVRDGRLPTDYKMAYAQPQHTRTFMTEFKRNFRLRLF